MLLLCYFTQIVMWNVNHVILTYILLWNIVIYQDQMVKPASPKNQQPTNIGIAFKNAIGLWPVKIHWL